MLPQTVIAIVLLLSIIGIAFWFFNERNIMGRIHEQTISKLESAIYTNRNQIDFRNTNLNRYDFQKYNLDDALVVQPKIQP